MNVAQVLTMNAGPSNPVFSGGKPLDSTSPSLNPLFALQLGAMLEGLPEVQSASEGQQIPSQEAVDGTVENLLTLLDQLLTEGLLTTEQHAQFTASLETGKATQSASPDGYLPAPLTTVQEHRQLVATFMQLGMTNEQAVALADVLAEAPRPDKFALQTILTPKEEAAGSLLSKQVQTAQAAQGDSVTTDRKNHLGMTFSAAGPQRFAEARVENRANRIMDQAMQPIRLQQALATYQAESGTVSRNPKILVQQVALAGSQMTAVAEEQGGVNQAPAVATWQIGQLQWINQPQGTAQPNSYPVQTQHFSEQVSQLFVKQLKLTEKNGITEAKLVLYPRSLGQIDVKISAHNGVITAHFTADTASGKELLDTQLGQLRIALVQQGLQVDRLEVNHQPSTQQQALDFQQQREQGRQQQHQQPAETFSSADEQAEFSLEALTEQSASLSTLWERARTAGSRLYSAYA